MKTDTKKEQAKTGIVESKKETGKVDLTKKVKVIGTGKFGLTKGKEYLVHPIKAETLRNKGAAK